MAILKWFDSNAAVSAAQELAREILDGLKQGARAQSAKKAQEKTARLIDKVLTKASAFKAHERPNLYQKAKLLNTLKWELREAGIEDSVIDRFISSIAPRL